MGVSTELNRIPYAGNGATTSFNFPYKFQAVADIRVYLYDTTTGANVPQTRTVDFNISGTPDAQGVYPTGANIVFASAPASGKTIVIARIPDLLQNYSLDQNGQINSSALVQEIDKIVLLEQRLAELAFRSLVQDDGFGGTFSSTLPAGMSLIANANKALIINSSATGMGLGPSTTDIAAAAANAAAAAASATAAAGSATTAAGSASASATSATASAASATAAAASALAANAAVVVTGTRAVPQQLTTSLPFVGNSPFNTWNIKGSGGAVTLSATPRIAAGTTVGQRLTLIGRDDTNTVTLPDAQGVDLNGPWVGSASASLSLEWDGTNWLEIARR